MDEWRPIAPVDEMTDEIPRSATSLTERMRHLRDLLHWIGVGRVLGTIAVVPVIGFGVYLLVRTPPSPTEATIAYATTSPSAATATVLTQPARERVLVHVAGHVLSPGVYALEEGQRIVDAIRAAGGAQAIADLDAINLALVVGDGDQVYVPAIGEVQLSAAVGRVGSGSPGVDPVFPVNINTADAATLEELPGIGPSTAAAIIGHRDKIGSFSSPADLLDVPGIGSAKFEALKELVTT